MDLANIFSEIPRCSQNLLTTIPKRIAVAVSGGADSMALVLQLTEQYPEMHITALTVDHDLRTESATEAQQVKEWLMAREIEHHTLTWKGEKPNTNIQSSARTARYDLMTTWCRKHDIHHLFVAHTMDDQIETFLLRLARGSGVYGLAGMEPISSYNDVQIVRPLLHTNKDELRTYLRTQNQQWIEDPSNTNERYHRVKIRHLIPTLEEAGISKERIHLAVQNMARTKDYIESEVSRAWSECVVQNSDTAYTLNLKTFYELHEEIAYRLLKHIIHTIGGKYYPPRFDELERLYSSMAGRTLGNCKFSHEKQGNITISKEK